MPGFDDIPQIPGLDDLVGGLPGGDGDRFTQLFKQDESEFKQFGESKTDRRNWSGTKDKSAPDYFFLLKYGPKTIQVPFKISPQREIVSHPHAMTISYAQGGGKIVSSDGMISKDITIQGTCGLFPGNKKLIAPASGIGSGLEQIKFLETLFARYCFLKRNGDGAKALQLIYVNRRLQDAWVIEPKTFTREDAVEHNNSFSYTIVLETLYPYNGADAKGIAEQLLALVPGFSDFDSVSQSLVESVDNLNAVIGEASAIVDGVVNLVLSPVTALAQAIADIATGNIPNLASFKKDATKSLIANLASTANALEAFDAATGNNGLNAKNTVNAFINAQKACTATLTQDELYQPTPTTQAGAVAASQSSQAANSTNADGSSVSPAEAAAVGAATLPPGLQELLYGNGTAAKPPSLAESIAGLQALAAFAVPWGSTALGSAALQQLSQNPAALETLAKTNPELAATLKAALDAQNKAKAASTVGGTAQAPSASGGISLSSPTNDGPTSSEPGVKAVALSGSLSKFSITPPSFKDKQTQAAWTSSLNKDLAAINPVNASYKTAIVAFGDDIQTLAQRLLNDSGKWPQLVMLNNLTQPYVASQAFINTNSLTNVIAWGQPILYPAPKTTAAKNSHKIRNETDASVALKPFERTLGVDVMIDENTGDVVWGANDLELTYGVATLKQFIRKRVTTRKGILRRAPSLGYTDFIGYSDGVSEDLIRAETEGLFIDDDRIESAEATDIQRVAQSMVIMIRAVVRDLQDPLVVPVQI